jgi:hypothetical protein
MMKVKTFTCPLKVFHVKEELEQLDQAVNRFIEQNNITTIVSVSDTTTSDDSGASIGVIRVVTYA